ncbi:MAG TPA: IS66 family transposase [Candidatus Sulfotelmatobacter sp.]|nr:IS66 family transposase [Candidatus Sulfotelmatobacter sp.]
MRATIEFIDMDREELNQLVQHASASLSAEEQRKLKGLVEALSYLTDLVADQKTTIHDLRRLLFPASTEKTVAVLKQAGIEGAAQSGDKQAPQKPGKREPKAPGHGRNGAEDYRNPRRVTVLHTSLKHGDRCPGCLKGKLYKQQEPRLLVRIVGQAPLTATVYELQRLRCNLCGEVYSADAPEGVGEDKYDESAAAMIAQLKYGTGMPFYRLEHLEQNLGIPLPTSTQWEIVEEGAELIKPARDELIRQAAQGEVLHNDDTSMRVLALRRAIAEEDGERTGIFTSGVVSTAEGHKIALFFTGRQHAGENLANVLKRRAAELPTPIQMSDALSRNAPKPIKLLVGHCLAHGRRQFVQITPNFPEQCRHVLEALGEVYYQDRLARERGLSRIERLHFHQQHSKPVMDDLHQWLEAQLDEHHVEPNSGLGKAISYMLRHWQALTLFLREPGAPLDNNLVERALKKAILHRKNSLFYKTLNGADVGDLYMSLIHTCELNDVNPFEYLTELQRHTEELAAKPADWMPWNYQLVLERSLPKVS